MSGYTSIRSSRENIRIRPEKILRGKLWVTIRWSVNIFSEKIEKNWNHDINMAIKEIFFLDIGANHFWFFACIACCYLIYPVVYYLLASNKRMLLYFSLACYMLCLLILIHFNADLYYSLNRVITRIPIFVLGAIAGELVYKDEIISPRLIF